MPYNFVADSFQRNFVADFLLGKCDLRGKSAVLGLEATYNDHLTIIGKRILDFLLVLIEFST